MVINNLRNADDPSSHNVGYNDAAASCVVLALGSAWSPGNAPRGGLSPPGAPRATPPADHAADRDNLLQTESSWPAGCWARYSALAAL